ncbi:Fads2 protein [Strongyloides ratti]|uniref:Fads2 protein n=1 Tax=Strongyloides ratti TaxID=34506 RepID=A0A090LMK7_STRRB|nr:Fads2 protein [Strongyloides ratti]CEF70976.1 Fads2 protein [Strongyloides ratti]
MTSDNECVNKILIKPIKMKIDGLWLEISEDVIKNHPGGAVLSQYSDSDATHIFHAFHEGSEIAYKQLNFLKKHKVINVKDDPILQKQNQNDCSDINVSTYDYTIEEEKAMVKNFEKLREKIFEYGLMDDDQAFYIRKTFDTLTIMSIAFVLQYYGWYFISALVLGLAWQQLGWLCHEYCHHQPGKDRKFNNVMSIFLGNICQGFSRDWWKDKHNTHHAATNIIDHDTDIDLTPLVAFVPKQLKYFKQPIEKLLLKIIPYQHLYFTLMLPLIRVSWTSQSIAFVFAQSTSQFKQYRINAFWEQLGIIIHWTWVLGQLYLLPDNTTRIWYFLLSQLLGGFLIGFVVTFNHNSVDKYPENSRILNNFVALQILTTRNMNPSVFTDWLWGGLNYQIEHHLFPTMPRSNLNSCSKLVKKFCKDNKLPYYCDDYATGYSENLKQLEKVARLLAKNKIVE